MEAPDKIKLSDLAVKYYNKLSEDKSNVNAITNSNWLHWLKQNSISEERYNSFCIVNRNRLIYQFISNAEWGKLDIKFQSTILKFIVAAANPKVEFHEDEFEYSGAVNTKFKNSKRLAGMLSS